MAKPSEKSQGMENFLEKEFGRTTAITSDKCIPPPYGCSGDASSFRDEISRKEYTISGLCQKCQDEIYGESDD